MPLRKADTSATKRFDDGDDWMVLRTALTKGESDRLRDLTAAYKMDPAAFTENPQEAASIEIENRVAQANRALFEMLCEDWSLGEVTGRAYAELDEESGRWVDECIAGVLAERRERAEKNSRPSPGKRSGRGSSSRAASR